MSCCTSGTTEPSSEHTNYDIPPTWMQVIVGSICVMSILGSLAIIVTYALVKEIRSKARELLVHIALMDITYTTANLVGLSMPYHEHILPESPGNDTEAAHHEVYWRICRAQAFFSVYGTVSSVLWTLALAVYLYYRTVARDATVSKRLVKVLYVVCYVLPLYVSLWLLLDHHVGYSYYATSGAGWCFVNDHIKGIEILMIYDIWLWMGVIILIPLYLTIYVHTKHELKRLKMHYLMTRDHNPHGASKAERKLLLVPVGFILLRIWDIIDDLVVVYMHHHLNDNRRNWLKLLNAIGDCGQGLVNFIIFFVFQPQLRALAINIICRCYCCCYKKPPDHQRPSFLAEEGDDEVEENDKVLKEPGDTTFSQHTPH